MRAGRITRVTPPFLCPPCTLFCISICRDSLARAPQGQRGLQQHDAQRCDGAHCLGPGGRGARAPLRLGATLTLPFLKPAGCGVSALPLVTAGSFPRSCHRGTGWGLRLCCPKAPEAQRCGDAASEISRCQLLVPITVWEGKAGRASAAGEQEEEHDGKGKHLVLLQGEMFSGCIRSLALSLQVPPDILGSCRKGTATRGQNPSASLQLPGMLGTSWSH